MGMSKAEEEEQARLERARAVGLFRYMLIRGGLAAALAAAAARPPVPLYAGDAANLLPALVEAAPRDLAICLFHTAFLAHLPARDRQRFEHQVPALSDERPIYWIQAEPRQNPAEPRLRLTTCQNGRVTGHWPLGNYHPHGEWLEWTASALPTA